MADLLDNLNERQREAVLETEGYVRVIAGAGSGKTKLLVSRYAYLVQDYGIDPSNILCVTFTNKAAGEMKKRIRNMIGQENEVGLVCTYHGFCNRLLRENPEKLFLNRQFQIMDTHQQKAIMGEIYQKFELKLDYASFEAMLRKIGHAKRDLSYVPKLCNPRPCQILEEIKNQDDRIVEEFLQRQKAVYALDFHDLIAFAIYLLETDGDVREKWQDRLNYIMVDEFQDSSSIEMRLVELLSGKYRNLMIVGDPDQNIYEWRGTDVKLLVDFDKEHDPTRTIILNRNYRSTPQILKCANTLIEKNEIRLKKDLYTKNPNGEPVVHYHSKDEYEEMDHVIAAIKGLQKKEGFRYSDFAILYRSGFLSRVAEKKLVEKNIPYEIFGGIRFYQRMEILDMLAYLKLIAYGDDSSFRRIVNTPRRRFGRAKLNLLEQLREREGAGFGDNGGVGGSSLFDTLSRNLEEQEFRNSDAGKFVRLIETMRENCGKKPVSEIVNQVACDSGYESYIRELGDEERLENLAEFKRIANEFEREFGEKVTLEEFLRQIALQSEEDGDGAKDAVKLMTIHSSKGLEFPVVFILGFTEGIFPSSKTLGERKKLGLEEERRLCYVAMTRAERYLFLMESEGLSQNGIQKLVSRFLEEIGEENYVRIGRISEELKRESRGYAAKLNREMQQELPETRKVGDVVEHHVFGRGIIEAIDEKRGSYSVRFDNLKYPRNISGSYFAKRAEAGQQGSLRPAVAVAEGRPEEQKENPRPAIAVAEGRPEEQKENPLPAVAVAEGRPEEQKGNPRPAVAVADEWSEEEQRQLLVPGNTLKQTDTEQDGIGDGNPEEASLQLPENTYPKMAGRMGEAEEMPDVEMPSNIEGLSDTKEPAEPAETQEPDETIETSLYEETEQCDPVAMQAALLKEQKKNTPNLWKREDVPHSGWNCVGVEDLGAPVGICQMCGYQIIRYAHQMEHPKYPGLSVGCVCAGKMEGDIKGAKQREAEFKKKQTRRIRFYQKKWKRSAKGNDYMKIDDHIVVIYNPAKTVWKYSIDNTFCKTIYPTREKALAAVFEALEQLRT